MTSRLRLPLLAFAGVAAAVCAPMSSAVGGRTESFPGRAGTFVYICDCTGDNAMYVLSVQNRKPRLLREGEGFIVGSQWSPDGRRIAYAAPNERGWDIYVTRHDGAGRHRVTTTGTSLYALWSADGTHLLTILDEPGTRIDLLDLTTGRRRIIFDDAQLRDDFTLSPAGGEIAFTKPDGVYVAGLDDLRERRVSRGASSIDWSADAKRLFAVDRDGVRVIEIASQTSTPLLEVDSVGGVIAAPDGIGFAYVQSFEFGATIADRLMVVRPSGSTPRELVDVHNFAGVDWQPLCTIYGTERGDVLRGTAGRDVICGLGGDDRIDGRGGNDVIQGGNGDDRLHGGAGADWLFGGAGRDELDASSGGRDIVDGGPGLDRAGADPESIDTTRDVERSLPDR
ncbi:MAG: hypothetical protein ABR521_08320 [Gaiellaceae bacterium]